MSGYNFNVSRDAFLSPEDLAIVAKIDSAMDRAIASYVYECECLLVGHLEILLGRVPSNNEIRQHGLCGIHPDGTREYQWKGETFLKIAPIAHSFSNPEN